MVVVFCDDPMDTELAKTEPLFQRETQAYTLLSLSYQQSHAHFGFLCF